MLKLPSITNNFFKIEGFTFGRKEVQNFTFAKKEAEGFTLVEILVAITITAVVAAIAIPNLNRFNNDQESRNAASQLVSDLRKLQSNAQSGLKCPTGTSAVSWKIVLGTNSYQQFCTTASADQSVGTTTLPTNSSITLSPATCPSGTIIFTKTTISGDCLVTFNGSTNPTLINITKGGAIY